VASAPDAILVVGADGRILLANPEAARMFGYPLDELVGEPVEVLIPERLRDAHRVHRTGYVRRPARRPMGSGLDLVARRRDGTEVPIDVSLSPIEGTGSGTGAVIAIARDVTERRRAEALLRESLERERAAAEALRAADRLKDEFLATVSHELRTPLTAVVGFAALIQQKGVAPAELIDPVVRNAQEMHRMIERLLDFSRLEAGRVTVHPEPLDLAAEVRRIATTMADVLAAHPVEVVVPAGLHVMGDPHALDRVLGNLLANAAKFSPAQSPVVVTAEPDGATVVVSVLNHGPGVPAELAERVFERFVQGADQPAGHRGTGIGLAIVRRYVELLGGRAWYEPAPGGGARFRFTLPAAG
jgi:protein-histidine pros-kinase